MNPAVETKVYVDFPLHAKMQLELFSSLEGKVPYGKQNAFINECLREHYEWHVLDLKQFGFPEGFFVKGPEAMIARLEVALRKAHGEGTL